VALDLIGVVLPCAFHREGAWCMHASAVLTPAGAVAFVAPRGTGKSTLAAACVQHGWTLVADDVVVLRDRGGLLTVTPSGVPLRLGAETARAVGVATSGIDGWGKARVASEVAQASVPVAAVYLLSAVSADTAVERRERPARAAALALLTNGKITELLGGSAAGEALARCVSLAARMPVYDLAVPRDLAQLPQVVHALRRWHAATLPSATPA
jgi:serine kinase of HPr protein (carbohydrate metabolism regulator)